MDKQESRTRQLDAMRVVFSSLYGEGKYRPTIFNIVQNHEGLFGVGIQNTKEAEWGLIQGGFEPSLDVSLTAACHRETLEEIGIGCEWFDLFIEMVYEGKIMGSRHDAFTTGAFYVGYFTRLKEGAEICLTANAPQPQEILEWRWGTIDEISRLLVEQHGTKATERTREKGQKIFCPALRAAVTVLEMYKTIDKL